MLSQDLLDNLVLIISQLVDGFVGLATQRRVLLADLTKALVIGASEGVGLLLPGISNLNQILLLLVVKDSKLITAAGTVLVV